MDLAVFGAVGGPQSADAAPMTGEKGSPAADFEFCRRAYLALLKKYRELETRYNTLQRHHDAYKALVIAEVCSKKEAIRFLETGVWANDEWFERQKGGK